MTNVYVLFSVALSINFIPFFVILCGNIIIAVVLVHAYQKRRSMVNLAADSDNNKLQALTKTILIVSLSYLVFTTPYYIFTILWPYTFNMYKSFNDFWCGSHLWYISTLSIMCINYSINFLLYCIGGKRFRNEFLSMISCLSGSNA